MEVPTMLAELPREIIVYTMGHLMKIFAKLFGPLYWQVSYCKWTTATCSHMTAFRRQPMP